MRNGVLSAYAPPSWWSDRGRWKVVKDLEARLPDVGGSLFLTLTFDPARFDGPEQAFEQGRARIRRMMHRLRKGVEWQGRRFKLDGAYCVKVEFHAAKEDDPERGQWAHFHLVFLTRHYLPNELLAELWGFGFTKTKRISNNEFRYLLKYVVKGGGEPPEWVLRRGRLRVFQGSKGFLRPRLKPAAKAAPEAAPEGLEPAPRAARTIGERREAWARSALLVWEGPGGRLGRRVVPLWGPWNEVFGALVETLARARRYLGEGRFRINSTWELRLWQEQRAARRPIGASS